MDEQSRRTVAHAVVIAGGGPTGLMLAAELALAHVDVALVERRENQDLEGMRAGGLHMRTLEVFDQRGIAERFISQGTKHPMVPFARMLLDVRDTPTRHNYSIGLWQFFTERTLAQWVSELPVTVYRGCEVTQFAQSDNEVNVELSDGRTLSAKYLVGCDGGRSLVRKKSSIEFAGWDASTSYLIAEIDTAEEPEWGFRRTAQGTNAIGKIDDGKRARIVVQEAKITAGVEPTLSDVRDALIGVYGKDFGLRSASYVSRFTDMARQATKYWDRRVLLAGDAAHVHSPMGGQGLNLGVQDAVNLGWKLAQVVHGTSPESLLGTYHSERHPVGARVLRNTMALTALERAEHRAEALREMMCEMFEADFPRKQYVAMTSGLDLRYDLGTGHALLGRRMPDLDVTTASGTQRVFTFLHAARPILLNLAQPGAVKITGWAERVQLIDAQFTGILELPVLGAVSLPSAILIRPDGYVAWVGEGGRTEGLREALSHWFGSARN